MLRLCCSAFGGIVTLFKNVATKRFRTALRYKKALAAVTMSLISCGRVCLTFLDFLHLLRMYAASEGSCQPQPCVLYKLRSMSGISLYTIYLCLNLFQICYTLAHIKAYFKLLFL